MGHVLSCNSERHSDAVAIEYSLGWLGENHSLLISDLFIELTLCPQYCAGQDTPHSWQSPTALLLKEMFHPAQLAPRGTGWTGQNLQASPADIMFRLSAPSISYISNSPRNSREPSKSLAPMP